MLSRRRFLGATAAGSVALALRSTRLDAARMVGSPRAGCALLDLGDDCALRESLAGWATTGAGIVAADSREIAERALLIVPGALVLAPSLARRLLAHAHDGATVVVESGALFSDEPTFAAHRESLRAGLDVDVAPPMSLWPRPRGGVPYVAYHWPINALVRDFSRAVPPIPRERDAIIARVDDLPVALRRTVGAGELLVLGSPLGTALHFGDAEAPSWVSSVKGTRMNTDDADEHG